MQVTFGSARKRGASLIELTSKQVSVDAKNTAQAW